MLMEPAFWEEIFVRILSKRQVEIREITFSLFSTYLTKPDHNASFLDVDVLRRKQTL